MNLKKKIKKIKLIKLYINLKKKIKKKKKKKKTTNPSILHLHYHCQMSIAQYAILPSSIPHNTKSQMIRKKKITNPTRHLDSKHIAERVFILIIV